MGQNERKGRRRGSRADESGDPIVVGGHSAALRRKNRMVVFGRMIGIGKSGGVKDTRWRWGVVWWLGWAGRTSISVVSTLCVLLVFRSQQIADEKVGGAGSKQGAPPGRGGCRVGSPCFVLSGLLFFFVSMLGVLRGVDPPLCGSRVVRSGSGWLFCGRP